MEITPQNKENCACANKKQDNTPSVIVTSIMLLDEENENAPETVSKHQQLATTMTNLTASSVIRQRSIVQKQTEHDIATARPQHLMKHLQQQENHLKTRLHHKTRKHSPLSTTFLSAVQRT
jgi:hypothetical protein